MNATVEWLGGADQEQRAAFKRSLTVGNSGTVLLQTTISKVVQMLTNRALGIQSTLPRRSGSGDGFYSNRRTAATTGAEWVPDTGTVTNSEGAYTQKKFTYQTLLGQIKVTRQLVAKGRSYGDVLAIELIGKADDFTTILENASVVGNSTVSANQIDGLLTLVGMVSGQTIANTTVAAGDSLYLDKADETIQAVKGSSNKAAMRIYGSFKGQRLLNNALQAQQRFLKEGYEIEGGFVVESYQGIPVIESTEIPDDLTFVAAPGAGVTKIPVFGSGLTTALIFVNTTYVFYSELTPMTVMPLAKTSSQFDLVDMFLDITLVVDNSKGAAILAGLS